MCRRLSHTATVTDGSTARALARCPASAPRSLWLGSGGDGELACRRGSVRAGGPWVTIHLCDLPEGARRSERTSRHPSAWSCSRWGLPSRAGCPVRWCALTAPFHPYLCAGCPGHRRSVFCGTVLRVTPTGISPAPLLCGAPTFLDAVSNCANNTATPRSPGQLTVAEYRTSETQNTQKFDQCLPKWFCLQVRRSTKPEGGLLVASYNTLGRGCVSDGVCLEETGGL